MPIKSERIDKAVEIINYAIENHMSVREASKTKGYDYTYVKNVKAIVLDLYKNDAISEELFDKFNTAYSKYKETDKGKATQVNFDITESKEKPVDIPKVTEGEKTTIT